MRGRYRRRGWTPFRAWGLLLTLVAILLGYRHTWPQTVVALIVLAFYLLAVRLTRCRVETWFHRPCLWRVRGLLGTCDYHVGDKRSLPRLVRGDNFLGLPTFMWPRDDFAAGRPEPQPARTARGPATTARRANRPGYDWVMLALTAAGVVVAMLELLHDLGG